MSRIEAAYRQRTTGSEASMARARSVLPGGLTRALGSHSPYPPLIDRAEGAYLTDVDGNRYVDLMYNGLSLIHGHAYPPIVEALNARLREGWAWLGSSAPLIEFGQVITDRLATVERVVFTNSGTEASMLAAKLARSFTGRPYLLKATGAYHGTYPDLEAGIHGIGELPKRALLARFNDLASFERALAAHLGEVAAVVVEPVMYTGVVTAPEPGFLPALQELARKAGALFVLDDCLMLRLAMGGSAQKYGIAPDLTFLGKFIGGGLPVGVVGGRADIIDLADPERVGGVYHGGSFNGNLLGAVAGRIALTHLTAERIVRMDDQMRILCDRLAARAARDGVPLRLVREGSIVGLYFTTQPLQAGERIPNPEVSRDFHLACLNRGVQLGPGGLAGLSTVVSDETLAETCAALELALVDLAGDEYGRMESIVRHRT